MANVVNRVTKEHRRSVNTPDFDTAQWIINPDLSLVEGFASKYWLISGDTVRLMALPQRNAVDAAEGESQKDSIADEISVEPFQTAFAETLIDEINILRSEHGLTLRTLAGIKSDLRGKL